MHTNASKIIIVEVLRSHVSNNTMKIMKHAWFEDNQLYVNEHLQIVFSIKILFAKCCTFCFFLNVFTLLWYLPKFPNHFQPCHLQLDLSVSDMCNPGSVFCLLLGISSDYPQPITGQVTEVTCPVIGRAQPELTPSKRQKTGPGPQHLCEKHA